jgi:hypothetical protein
MKRLILILISAVAVLAQKPSGVPSTAETAPKPELFRDPLRKVRNANGELVNADLRQLFAWYQNRRGPRPMAAWDRFILRTVESAAEGVVVSNTLDNKVFFLRNYPYKVAANSVIHVFAVEDGYYTYQDSNGAEQTVHAYNYGIPSTSERKPGPEKPKSSPAK